MTPAEVNILLEANAPEKINGIHSADYDRMVERRAELAAQGYEVL